MGYASTKQRREYFLVRVGSDAVAAAEQQAAPSDLDLSIVRHFGFECLDDPDLTWRVDAVHDIPVHGHGSSRDGLNDVRHRDHADAAVESHERAILCSDRGDNRHAQRTHERQRCLHHRAFLPLTSVRD